MFSGESAAAPGAPRPSTTGGFCFGLSNCISERSARLRALHAHRRGHGCPRNVVGFIRHTFPSAWPLKGDRLLPPRYFGGWHWLSVPPFHLHMGQGGKVTANCGREPCNLFTLLPLKEMLTYFDTGLCQNFLNSNVMKSPSAGLGTRTR